MNGIVFRLGTEEAALPAPHPERIFTRDKDGDDDAVERQSVRFIDLLDSEAQTLRDWQSARVADGREFVFVDETAREWKARAGDRLHSVRHAPNNWEIVLELVGAPAESDPPEPEGDPEAWPEGWVRFSRGDVALVVPAPLAEQQWRQTPVQAVGVAADGSRHVYDDGRVRVERSLRFASLDGVRCGALARFHRQGAGGRDAFEYTDAEGRESWRFADRAFTAYRLAADLWRADVTLVRVGEG